MRCNLLKEWVKSALRCTREDTFAGWAQLLSLGRQLHPHLGVPRTDYWWHDERIKARQVGWQRGRDPFYPWREAPSSIAKFELDSEWLTALERAVDACDQLILLALTTLAAILYADDALAMRARKSTDGDPGAKEFLWLEHIERLGLVALLNHQRSWWDQVLGSGSGGRRSSVNPSFGDPLRAVTLTELPLRVYHPGDIGSFSATKMEEDLHIRLVAVEAPDDWFEIEAVRNATTGRPGFVARCREDLEWFGQVRDAMREGWLDSAQITLLPEMVVPQRLWLELQEIHNASTNENAGRHLIVAGSGHVDLDGGDGRRLKANRSALICRQKGNADSPTVSYLKSYAFDIERGKPAFKAWESRCRDRKLLAEARKEGFVLEALEAVGGTEDWPLVAIDSPWGRLGIAICRDILIDVDSPLIRSLIDARIDHLLVPSYNPGAVMEFERAARILRRHGIATYLVDACPEGPACEPWLVTLPLSDEVLLRDGCLESFRHGLRSLLVPVGQIARREVQDADLTGDTGTESH